MRRYHMVRGGAVPSCATDNVPEVCEGGVATGVRVRVDPGELVVVVLVGMLVGGPVAGIVHAGSEVRIVEVFVLVGQAEVVADLLAHHALVFGGAAPSFVGVVHLGAGPADVPAVGGVDRRQSGPTGLAVGEVAHPDPAGGHGAAAPRGRVRRAGHNPVLQVRALVPVVVGRYQVPDPAPGEAGDDGHLYRPGPGPVKAAPRMVGVGRRGRKSDDDNDHGRRYGGQP